MRLPIETAPIRITIPATMVRTIREKCTAAKLDFEKVVEEIHENARQAVHDLWIDQIEPDAESGALDHLR